MLGAIARQFGPIFIFTYAFDGLVLAVPVDAVVYFGAELLR